MLGWLGTNLKLISMVVAGLSALGMAILFTASFLQLPNRVQAAERNIDDLKGWAREIQGYTRAMQEQQGLTELLRQTDRWGAAWCCDPRQVDCRDRRVWMRCDG